MHCITGGMGVVNTERHRLSHFFFPVFFHSEEVFNNGNPENRFSGFDALIKRNMLPGETEMCIGSRQPGYVIEEAF